MIRQSPYCILSVGTQTHRTQTATRAGKNPVWNETFQFNIGNENDLTVELKDSEIGRDPNLGIATVNLSRVREMGQDNKQVPVMDMHNMEQHGILSVSLRWQPEMYGGGMTGQQMYGGIQQGMYGGGMMDQQQMYGGGMMTDQQQMYGGAGGGMMMGGQMMGSGDEYRPPHHHHQHHQRRPGEVVEEYVVIEERRYD
ncbi:hypothetical protein VOLCADRAFT_103553 [Volvox carteri f. nagariensis]|uniref:C2 domain-containing protein n=1 Tax=Volvox carteri f. nagariensis TaxID=3068 RepID=D8TMR5_VOLCA|nr:uncharacterized protein VOLCADRAFT_103553 [Volvox carteri f. nagariensis]EFJ51299.1 hypothetical protein VOLCADRAFT_103553 [Volvox carteri f. nagariensis]|eukprot:XP_002947766.1 hypothetical protein VOLCADRAFT_103553 [Volvox carteri f. nagariensis]